METTPFMVKKTDSGYRVENGWTGRDWGIFATREEAQAEAIRLKRERG